MKTPARSPDLALEAKPAPGQPVQMMLRPQPERKKNLRSSDAQWLQPQRKTGQLTRDVLRD